MAALNKQTLINLLIDSPLREPIKINLIDIVNNTNEVDLPKTYSTISKELEIFQKATERRMKLADETIAKLKDDGSATVEPTTTTPTPAPSDAEQPSSLPPLPPLPSPSPSVAPSDDTSLKVPPLDLPPLPISPKLDEPPATSPVVEPAPPVPPVATPAASSDAPLPPAPTTVAPASADEDALKEIQKELDALKTSATEEAAPVAPPAPQA